MLRGLYDWTLSLAAKKSAEWWLAFIAFVESSVFLVPADVLFLPMALSRPDRAYRYALVATARFRSGRHRRLVHRPLCLRHGGEADPRILRQV